MISPPPRSSVERWAFDFATSERLAEKFDLSEPPAQWETDPPVRRLTGPGRPPELSITGKTPRSVGASRFEHPRRRAAQLHTFLHHELQAAELMCWALLAFPGAPQAFRQGLTAIARDEVRHMRLYRRHLETLGMQYGELAVRDWFWERVPQAQTPAQFVAFMGIGLEGSNLDHAARFARRFAEAGDPEGARIQRLVAEEEIAHVRFATHWFAEFTGGLDFDEWARHLPPPLTPALLHGRPLQREARRRAGLPESFLDRLADSGCASPGS